MLLNWTSDAAAYLKPTNNFKRGVSNEVIASAVAEAREQIEATHWRASSVVMVDGTTTDVSFSLN